MADRIAVGRIISGHGATRRIVEPGVRFDTASLGINDSDLRRLEARGVVRRPRDAPPRPAPAPEPVVESETVADDPAEVETAPVSHRRRRHASADLDDL
jgi:hypothetical protein